MEVTHCYVAKAPGIPGAYAACADMILEHPKDTAQFIAKEQKRGAVIERVPTEQARSLLMEFFKWQTDEEKRTGKHPRLFARKPRK